MGVHDAGARAPDGLRDLRRPQTAGEHARRGLRSPEPSRVALEDLRVLAEVLADEPCEVLDDALLPSGDAVAVVQEEDHAPAEASLCGRMDLAVQIVNFNTRAHLVPCLDSVVPALERSGLTGRVLVLENGSGDDLADLAPRFGAAVDWHESPVNLGFGGGQNRLARATRSRHLCFVNPDVVMPGDTDVFGALVGALSDPGVAVAGPMLVGTDGTPQRWDHGELRGLRARISNGAGEAYWSERHERADVAWISGACMVVARDAFEAVGGFDERYFLYKEEEDLCLRIRRAGRIVRYEPAVRVTHVGSVVARRAPEHFRPSIEHYLRKNFPHRWRRRLLRVLYLGWARRG